jgi:beta-1,4-N-acetylglucosaminyltransferase
MIFTTVGTTDFDALVRRMDELVPAFDEPAICQIGKGSYIPRHCQYFRFAPSLSEYIRNARVVVSHGGQGSIMEVLRLRRPLVGVSNPDRRDLHQDDILGKLEQEGHLLWCRSLDQLADVIVRAATTEFAHYAEPVCNVHTIIDAFLQSELRARARPHNERY